MKESKDTSALFEVCAGVFCVFLHTHLKREPGQHCTCTEVAVRPWGHFAGDMKSEKTLILLPFVCLPHDGTLQLWKRSKHIKGSKEHYLFGQDTACKFSG